MSAALSRQIIAPRVRSMVTWSNQLGACHVEISTKGVDSPYGTTWQPDEAPVQMTVDDLRHAFEIAKTIKEPGIYFTGKVFLCNQTRGTTTIDRNPYRYD